MFLKPPPPACVRKKCVGAADTESPPDKGDERLVVGQGSGHLKQCTAACDWRTILASGAVFGSAGLAKNFWIQLAGSVNGDGAYGGKILSYRGTALQYSVPRSKFDFCCHR
jgi:hypothetical protein